MGCVCCPANRDSIKKLETIESPTEYMDVEVCKLQSQSAKYTFLKERNYCNDLVYLSEGGTGTVYSGQCDLNNKRYALKFFGYVRRKPELDDIFSEIEKMQAFCGVKGIVQYEGIIMDSEEGILPNKIHKFSYPIIVMELLDGGELFQKIHHKNSISEYDISRMFRDIVLAVENIHSRGYIHRDLKLENLMLVNKSEDAQIKLIDFDIMVKIPPGDGVYRGCVVNGSAGYIAPESILYFNYSTSSDVWQLGCILYTMLSGFPAFDPHDTSQATSSTCFPMEGIAWDGISEPAKDLIREMLNKSPKYRIGTRKILEHPWMTGVASTTTLGEAYIGRIRNLALRQQLRSFFTDSEIGNGYKHRKDKLRDILPLLLSSESMVVGSFASSDSGSSPLDTEKLSDKRHGSNFTRLHSIQEHEHDHDSESFSSCVGGEYSNSIFSGFSRSGSSLSSRSNSIGSRSTSDITITQQQEQSTSENEALLDNVEPGLLENKEPDVLENEEPSGRTNPTGVLKHVKTMKVMLLNASKPRVARKSSKNTTVTNSSSKAKKIHSSLSKSESSMSSSASSTRHEGMMTYQEFAPIYAQLDMPKHAFSRVCSVFDPEGRGYIDIKDFLITMLSLRRDSIGAFASSKLSPEPITSTSANGDLASPSPQRHPPFSPAVSGRDVGTLSFAKRVDDDGSHEDLSILAISNQPAISPDKMTGDNAAKTPSSCGLDGAKEESNVRSYSEPSLSFESDKESSPQRHPQARGIDEGIIKLYFDIFDVDEDGFIQIEDLRLVAMNLLVESKPRASGRLSDRLSDRLSYRFSDRLSDKLSEGDDTRDVSGTPLSPLIRDLFGVMDSDNNRMIDYSEFKTFFLSLSQHPMLRRM